MAEQQVVVVTAKSDRKVFTGGKGLCDTSVLNAIKVCFNRRKGNYCRKSAGAVQGSNKR